ncbi:disease resistance protein RPV1 isoform X2 [Cryptomeria japonica]|uniref:disease resistance protein RPV1 isoform X2 n=1 Tax=Cryptomeria japonica TaxID=3369 RepID=UPI0027D9FDBE|nr:disease resistance protein RPV1 isoform X2 [Cryptomeria japonica]
MATNSITGGRAESEPTNNSQGTASSSSTLSTSSSRSLFSCCFGRSVESNVRASNSATSARQEEPANTPQVKAPSSSCSTLSSRSIFSCCFGCSKESKPMTSASTNDPIPENEVMGTSASTNDLIPENEVMGASASTIDLIPENEVMGASAPNFTSDLIQENKVKADSEGITPSASTSTSDLVPENQLKVALPEIAPSASTSTPDLVPENQVTAAFPEIAPSASTSNLALVRENRVTGAFQGIAPPASTSTSTLMHKPCYDVFINHRGPDCKHTLASSIYNLLKNMKVPAFLDSEELEYGDFLPTTLEAAMRNALLHIAIFSKTYADSAWCLAELSFMLKTGAKIVPVFYHVEPTDLRWVAQGKGKYVDAFVKYENKGRYSPEKLQEWKKALQDVSFYTGEIVKCDDDEKRLLKKIASCVLKVKDNVPLDVAKHPVGLQEIVQEFEMKMLQSAEGVHIVGIWGMGGSGKTTLAKELYNKRSSSIERPSFIFDVRDSAAKGLLQNKQIQLLKDLGVENVTFDNTEHGKAILKRHLRYVKVFIVVDDVDGVDQLDALLPTYDSLLWGSLIIVTTREYEVLRSWGISSVYKMRPLDPVYAEQLFCWHAFLQPSPLDGFEELVKKFLEACNGLPLSLKVFGGQLYGQPNKEYWESLLHKICRILPDDIKEKLRVSYDALDDEEKEMFLDTACFLIEEENSLAIELWNGSGWSGLHGWEKLLNKCLVELDKDNHIRMHDHLRDLGREVANQHSPYRLWLPQQIINVEKQTEAGKTYQVMIPSRSSDEELMPNSSGGNWSLTPSLHGLKIFVIRGDYCNKVMCEVSRELVWLRWFEIGQRNLPSWLPLKNLWVLELYEQEWGAEHHLEELWESDNDAPVQLRELIISYCEKFQGFPTSIGCLNKLKKIVITEGLNFVNLPEEFCQLQSLKHLQLCGCNGLSSLPSSFGDLKNMRYLDLFNCTNLRRLPVSFKNLMLLEHLDLRMCEKLTFTSEDLNILENMTKLEFFRLSGCEQVEELPRHITNQASLRELYLDGMKRLRELAIDIGQLSRLQKLMIGSDLLTSLPNSLGDLQSLKNLSIRVCPKLESLPTSLGDLSSLTDLQISQCSELECLPFSVGRLNLLEHLEIYDCLINQIDFAVASLPSSAFSKLNRIEIWDTEVYKISISDHCYPCLEKLMLVDNYNLTDIEALPTTVKSITLSSCENLKNIRVICDLVNLERLLIKCCPELVELPSFAQLTSLTSFDLRGCDRVEKIEGLEYCTRLESLEIETLGELPGIKSLEDLKKLKKLAIRENNGSAIGSCIQTI